MARSALKRRRRGAGLLRRDVQASREAGVLGRRVPEEDLSGLRRESSGSRPGLPLPRFPGHQRRSRLRRHARGRPPSLGRLDLVHLGRDTGGNAGCNRTGPAGVHPRHPGRGAPGARRLGPPRQPGELQKEERPNERSRSRLRLAARRDLIEVRDSGESLRHRPQRGRGERPGDTQTKLRSTRNDLDDSRTSTCASSPSSNHKKRSGANGRSISDRPGRFRSTSCRSSTTSSGP